MRGLRNQINQWVREFMALWGRLTSFHRTALGIFIAIVMVWCARDIAIDPLRAALADLEEGMVADGVPDQVPKPEEDNDVQEAELLIENLQRTLETCKKREREAVTQYTPLRRSQKSMAIADIGAIITRSGLRVKNLVEEDAALPVTAADAAAKPIKKNSPTEGEAEGEKSKPPLPISVHEYTLWGTFGNVHQFLKEAEGFHWPCLINALSIKIMTSEEDKILTANGEPLIELSFNLMLYYYDETSR